MLFLDAIASLEIPCTQVTHLLTYSQSANHLVGQGSRPVRQSKEVKKGNTVIIAITANNMAITAITAITDISAITDIRAITASIGQL